MAALQEFGLNPLLPHMPGQGVFIRGARPRESRVSEDGCMNSRRNYFIVVAEERNLSRAAKRLFVSQQVLSAYIKNLEQELLKNEACTSFTTEESMMSAR